MPDLLGAALLWGFVAIVLRYLLPMYRWPKVRARVLDVRPCETRGGEWSLLLDVPQPGGWSREETLPWVGRAPTVTAGQFITLRQNPMDPAEIAVPNLRGVLPLLLGLGGLALAWTLAIVFLD